MFTIRRPIESFISTTKRVLLTPVQFFQSVSWNSVPIIDSVLYALICSIFGILFSNTFYFLRMVPFSLPTGFSALPSYSRLIYSSGYSLFFIGITTVIVYILVKLIFHKESYFLAIFSSLAATSATQLFSWIPIIGPIIGLYGFVLTIIAIRESVYLSTTQAIVIVVLIIIFLGLISPSVYTGSFLSLTLYPTSMPF